MRIGGEGHTYILKGTWVCAGLPADLRVKVGLGCYNDISVPFRRGGRWASGRLACLCRPVEVVYIR